MVVVGVLALQGDYLEHKQLLSSIPGIDVTLVKKPGDLKTIDALVLPGGESTTQSLLMERSGLKAGMASAIRSGLPVLGTCAGAILLAKNARDSSGRVLRGGLGVMDISVVRNAFGSQGESFEAPVHLKDLGGVRGVFIRAPVIEHAGGKAEILAYLNHPELGRVGVAAREENMLAVSFHPELAGEAKLYKVLVREARR